jgi:hypothetical protein
LAVVGDGILGEGNARESVLEFDKWGLLMPAEQERIRAGSMFLDRIASYGQHLRTMYKRRNLVSSKKAPAQWLPVQERYPVSLRKCAAHLEFGSLNAATERVTRSWGRN